MGTKLVKKHIVRKSAIVILMSVLWLPILAHADIVTCDGPDCSFKDLMSTFNELIKTIVIIGVAAVAIVMSWAGFKYLTAGGDTGKISEAHKVFSTALKGFIFMIAAYLIVQLLFSTLDVDSAFNKFDKRT